MGKGFSNILWIFLWKFWDFPNASNLTISEHLSMTWCTLDKHRWAQPFLEIYPPPLCFQTIEENRVPYSPLFSRSRRKIVFAGNLISQNWRLSDFIFSFLQKFYVNQQLKQNQYAVPVEVICEMDDTPRNRAIMER